jgi:hypothetical protein
MEDLSNRHELVGELLRERGDAELDGRRLEDSELAHFHEHGFVSGIRLLNEAQLDLLRGELQKLQAPNHSGRSLWHEYHVNENDDPDAVVFHALGAWRIAPGFHDLLWHPVFVRIAEQLLEGPVRFWHDQLFCKPPRHGGNVSWHQDYSYWTRTSPLAHLTCWIALDDATIDNGCIQYIPGSHRWGLLPVTGLVGDMDQVHDVLDDEQQEAMANPVAVELKAGECTFHHAMLMHGSGRNRTDHSRRGAVLNVVRDGVISTVDEPLLAGQPVIGSGNPLGGAFHPLLSASSGRTP